MSDIKPKVELTADRDVIITHLNRFRKDVIDNTLDLKRHLVIQKENPEYERPTQNGQLVGIDKLIKNYRTALDNAKSYVSILEELLKADDEGNLQQVLNEASLIAFDPKDLEGKKD